MLQATPASKARHASETDDAPDEGIRRSTILSAVVVLSLALASGIATTFLVADSVMRTTEEDLQARASAFARTIDQKLRTYSAALDTIAESYSLREDFNLSTVE